MKPKLFALLILLPAVLLGQHLTNDFFPLSVGNTWSYAYHHTNLVTPGDWYTMYHGIATYVVLSKSSSPDSIVWRFRQTRNVRYSSGDPYLPDSLTTRTTISDTSLFDLIELQDSCHTLQIPSAFIDPFGFLTTPISDSVRFSRFSDTTSQDTVFTRSWNNHWSFLLAFAKNIGPVQYFYFTDYPTGNMLTISDTLLQQTLTSVAKVRPEPSENSFVLRQSYPNPFNPETHISFATPNRSNVTIEIYDILGRPVQKLFQGSLPAGEHSMMWNAGTLASGTYVCVVSANQTLKTMKLVLLK